MLVALHGAAGVHRAACSRKSYVLGVCRRVSKATQRVGGCAGSVTEEFLALGHKSCTAECAAYSTELR